MVRDHAHLSISQSSRFLTALGFFFSSFFLSFSIAFFSPAHTGRKVVMTDPTGADFPWRAPAPKTLAELISGPLKNNKGEKFDGAAHLAGKTVGLYFSAHWVCQFSPSPC